MLKLILHDYLKEVLLSGLYPIVFLDMSLGVGNNRQYHALVIVEIIKDKILALDPIIGERIFNREEFNIMWAGKDGLTILIE